MQKLLWIIIPLFCFSCIKQNPMEDWETDNDSGTTAPVPGTDTVDSKNDTTSDSTTVLTDSNTDKTGSAIQIDTASDNDTYRSTETHTIANASAVMTSDSDLPQNTDIDTNVDTNNSVDTDSSNIVDAILEWDTDSFCTDSFKSGCRCDDSDAPHKCGPTTELGTCSYGVMFCISGIWSECKGEIMPGQRSCSSTVDNDCNGTPDNEEATCKCVPGSPPRACDPWRTEGRGNCTIGDQKCIDNNDGTSDWEKECYDLIEPEEETCDSAFEDENCNGQSNEGCFVGGACVISPDGEIIEILARGTNDKIFHKVISGENIGNWQETNLSASPLDIAAELDCTANANGTHIVARGNNPVGALMYASGTGNQFNPFIRKLESDIFVGHPAITSTNFEGGTYRIIAKYGGVLTQLTHSDTVSSIDNDALATISSSIDIADATYSGAGDKSYAGFVDNQTLLYEEYFNSSGGSGGGAPVFITSPSGTTYNYSPANCRKPIPYVNNSSNMIVVANGDLWFGIDTELEDGMLWEQVTTDAGIASSPDCIVTEHTTESGGDTVTFDTVHIVAQTSEDGLVLVQGNSGDFKVVYLGRYLP